MTDVTSPPAARERTFPLTLMGRTLEHLGVQMYKRRDTAIAELVANSWDAGATRVDIQIGDVSTYGQGTTQVVIVDDGEGMDESAIEDAYLVVGRNRRADGQVDKPDRPAMGRKGIGKLAGFGLAKSMRVESWQEDGEFCDLTLDVAALKQPAGTANTVQIPGRVSQGAPADAPWPSGTRLTLSGLKHKTALSPETLRQALARRFSRTVRGSMEISVNGHGVAEPALDIDVRVPSSDGAWQTETLKDGTMVRYWYAFTKKVIQSTQMRGWTILVRGKTAQAPNFYFFVEGTASGQHGTKYLTGVIEADDLDSGNDDESDLVSTDRQELDWEDERTEALRGWGDKLTREVLRTRANRRGDQMEKRISEDPALTARIDRLDSTSQKRVRKYIRTLGQADAEEDKSLELADQLVLAFEYQHFHDVLDELDEDDPEQLTEILLRLHDWKMLESRAILEIVQGRLQIVDKLAALLAAGAPETSHNVGDENLHDLLADYPWIINPEWQVLAEEKTVTRQLREWDASESESQGDASRFDFLALKGDGRLVVIEIKRENHAVSLDEVQRLETYRARLETATLAVDMVLISGGQFEYKYRQREDLTTLTWAEIHSRTKTFYEHYRSVLTGEVDADFDRKTREVQRTRSVVEHGAFRGQVLRKAIGLGGQDVDHSALLDPDEGDDGASPRADNEAEI